MKQQHLQHQQKLVQELVVYMDEVTGGSPL
jgi:hypothetical protein